MIHTNHTEALKDCLEEYLHRKGINIRGTFRCLNPEHRDSSPSMSFDRNNRQVHCFGCNAKYDVIDLIKIDEGVTDFNEAVRRGCQMFGIAMDTTQSEPKHTPQKRPTTADKKTFDYTAFIVEAAEHIGETDYHRGLSADTLRRFYIGYVPQWKWPLQEYLAKYPDRTQSQWEKIPTSPRLIIPTGESSYIARDTRADLTEQDAKYKKQKVGYSVLFNTITLDFATAPVFVVEGEIDALSIIDVGGTAIALGSTSNAQQLINLCKEKKPTQPLILCLDNDDAGTKTEAILKKDLSAIGVYCLSREDGIKITAYKDANDALMNDREGLKNAVQSCETTAAESYSEHIKQQAQAKEEALTASSAAALEDAFLSHVERTKTQPKISTGIPSFDALLGGQLYNGLYFIGAVSSLGKTTFLLQIADAIANAGRDVLFFSLEMSQYELIAKSISRISYVRALSDEGTKNNAATTRNILNGSAIDHDGSGIIARSIREYFSTTARHIFIKEGQGNISVQDIAAAVQEHTDKAGIAPVVMIDYLQILAPSDTRLTDKQNVDKAVVDLKRISRDFNTPVLAISSLNRENYTAPINLAAFKESGAIEYSSDFLIGLQFTGMDYQEGDSKDTVRRQRVNKLIKEQHDKGKHGNAERIQVLLLKNRNGATDTIELDYTPMFNHYWEAL